MSSYALKMEAAATTAGVRKPPPSSTPSLQRRKEDRCVSATSVFLCKSLREPAMSNQSLHNPLHCIQQQQRPILEFAPFPTPPAPTSSLLPTYHNRFHCLSSQEGTFTRSLAASRSGAKIFSSGVLFRRRPSSHHGRCLTIICRSRSLGDSQLGDGPQEPFRPGFSRLPHSSLSFIPADDPAAAPLPPKKITISSRRRRQRRWKKATPAQECSRQLPYMSFLSNLAFQCRDLLCRRIMVISTHTFPILWPLLSFHWTVNPAFRYEVVFSFLFCWSALDCAFISRFAVQSALRFLGRSCRPLQMNGVEKAMAGAVVGGLWAALALKGTTLAYEHLDSHPLAHDLPMGMTNNVNQILVTMVTGFGGFAVLMFSVSSFGLALLTLKLISTPKPPSQ